MKKIGMLLGILLIAGVCAMADEAVAVKDNLFSGINAVALSTVEMANVDGGFDPVAVVAVIGIASLADWLVGSFTGKSAVRGILSGDLVREVMDWADKQPAPTYDRNRRDYRGRSRD